MEIVSFDTVVLFAAASMISFFTSTGGVSGAFLLLPFQSFYFGSAAPSISATNHVFNILATPGGVYRYAREGRMYWSLVVPLVLGSIPGVIAGAWIRVRFLPDPQKFKLFAGLVLLAVASHLLWDILWKKSASGSEASKNEQKEVVYSRKLIGIFSAIVGLVGGIYGVGGGVFLAPFLVTIVGLSIRSTAGATLLCTWITSLVGALSFQVIAAFQTSPTIAPNWRTGVILGLGGLLGTYFGARSQKYFSVTVIKLILSVGLFTLGAIYIVNYST